MFFRWWIMDDFERSWELWWLNYQVLHGLCHRSFWLLALQRHHLSWFEARKFVARCRRICKISWFRFCKETSGKYHFVYLYQYFKHRYWKFEMSITLCIIFISLLSVIAKNAWSIWKYVKMAVNWISWTSWISWIYWIFQAVLAVLDFLFFSGFPASPG